MKYQVLINPSKPYYMAPVEENIFFDYYKDVTPFIESCYDGAVRTVQSAFPDMPIPTKEQYAGWCDVYQMRTYDNDTLQAKYTVTVKDGKFKLAKVK